MSIANKLAAVYRPFRHRFFPLHLSPAASFQTIDFHLYQFRDFVFIKRNKK